MATIKGLWQKIERSLRVVIAAFLRGMDISHWSGIVDWAVVRSNNVIQFVIAKTTEGTTLLDSQWLNNLAGCIQYKIPIAGYHFFRNTHNPIEQATWFIANLGSTVKLAVCDVETTTLVAMYGEEAVKLGKGRGMSRKQWASEIARITKEHPASLADIEATVATIEDDVDTFCQQCANKGYTPVIYTSPGFAATYFKTTKLAKWLLWIAHIGVSEPTIPYPWNAKGKWDVNPDVIMWQDTWTMVVDGVPEKSVDGNRWSAAAGDLYQRFGNGSPYVPPGELPSYLIVNTASLNIRKSVWGTVVGSVPINVCLKPFERAIDVYGKVWYKVGDERWVAGYLCIEKYV